MPADKSFYFEKIKKIKKTLTVWCIMWYSSLNYQKDLG